MVILNMRLQKRGRKLVHPYRPSFSHKDTCGSESRTDGMPVVHVEERQRSAVLINLMADIA
jgi:hypothetical protein